MPVSTDTCCLAALLLLAGAGQGVCQFAEAPACVLSGLSAPHAVAVGDLNNDGQPDLLVSSRFRRAGSTDPDDETRHRVQVFYRRDGLFRSPAHRELIVPNHAGVVVGDFDKDGKNDLAVGPAGGLYLYLGKENLEKAYSCADINGPIGTPRPCKLNTLGQADFLLGPVWLKWQGQGQFDHGYLFGPQVNDNAASLPVDFNADGETDVLSLSRDGKSLRLYYGPLLDMSVRPRDLAQSVSLTSPVALSSMAVGDLNGDGRLDIVAATEFHADPARRHIAIYFQNSPLHFTDKAGPSAKIDGLCGQLAVADVNGDSLDDVVIAAAGTETTCVFLQQRDKPWATTAAQADQVLSIGNNQHFVLSDLTGDGLPELIHSDGRATVRVFLNRTRKPASAP